jgi:hypothetical protein
MHDSIRRFALVGTAVVMPMIPWLTTAALSHDPGLSTSVVTLSKDGVTATLRIHDADLGDARDVAASDALVLSNGHGTIRPAQADKVVDSHGDAVFSLTFPAARESVLEVRVPLLARLPRGHKHHLEVRGDDGRLVSSTMLGAAAPRVIVPPP